MLAIKFHVIQPDNEEAMQLIAEWYLKEWNIPIEKSIQKLKSVAADPTQFHVIMSIDGVFIATGGLHHRVGLVEKETRFAIYENWLATVYTVPEWRQQGHGAALCKFIEKQAQVIGVKEMYLFTDTSERLYKSLGWESIEGVSYGKRNVVLMKKDLK